jgi:hypothetical protein
MELERNRMGSKAPTVNSKSKKAEAEVASPRLGYQRSDKATAPQVEVPSIRLSPEQIEEIHVDEYSLTLFYATRVEPLTVNDIKREFAEPEPKKAQAVMDRFIKVGLVHITPDGSYYSNYPENYINYSHYRYDGDLEARKDSKVFQLMKEFSGKSEYWKDKTYFSMDAFYSKEQSDELLEMFKAIKLKAKDFANENAQKKTIRGLRFRRMKFFDMTFAFLFAMLLTLGISNKSYAGGNDPVINLYRTSPGAAFNFLSMARFAGGGNDPTAVRFTATVPALYLTALTEPPKTPGSDGGGGHDPGEKGPTVGGGGHDPANPPTATPSCYFEYEGQLIAIASKRSCRLKILIDFMNECGDSDQPACVEAERQTELLIRRLEIESRTK